MLRLFGRCVLLGLALLALQPGRRAAQDYPSQDHHHHRAARAPAPAWTSSRGSTASSFRKSLGKPVIVENKPGAGFLTATQSVLAAPADGHTLLVAAPSNLAYNQILYKQLPYDPEKDLVPISHYLTSPFILVVNPALPVKSAPEFINTPRSSRRR